MNRYTYVNNNPVNFVDASGQRASSVQPGVSDATSSTTGASLETTPSPPPPPEPSDLVERFKEIVDFIDQAAEEVIKGQHSAEMIRLRDSLGAFARNAKPIGQSMGLAGNVIEGTAAAGAIAAEAVGALLDTGDLSYAGRVALWAGGREAAAFWIGEGAGIVSANVFGAGCLGITGNPAVAAGCAAGGYAAGNNWQRRS